MLPPPPQHPSLRQRSPRISSDDGQPPSGDAAQDPSTLSPTLQAGGGRSNVVQSQVGRPLEAGYSAGFNRPVAPQDTTEIEPTSKTRPLLPPPRHPYASQATSNVSSASRTLGNAEAPAYSLHLPSSPPQAAAVPRGGASRDASMSVSTEPITTDALDDTLKSPNIPGKAYFDYASSTSGSESESGTDSEDDQHNKSQGTPLPSIHRLGSGWESNDSFEQYDQKVAMEELKSIELAEFLERTSKHLDEVRFDDVQQRSAELPTLAQYTDKSSGKIDYVHFVEEYMCTLADTHLPKDLLSISKPSKLSLSRSRTAFERLYVLLPPEVIQTILEGKLADLYRWKDPVRTGSWAAVYLACWWYDQLPAALFVIAAYTVARPKLFPRDAAEIQAELRRRRLLSDNARDLAEDMKKREKIKKIAPSMGISALMVSGVQMQGMSMGTSRETHSSSGEGDAVPGKKDKRIRRGKYGVYKLGKEVLDRLGPIAQLALLDAADYCEKAKNLVIWRRPKATQQSLVIIGLCALILSILPGYLQSKLLLLWVWFQFFVVWALQDRYPRYRRALNPAWYLLWNVPNDAESALEILRERAQRAPPTPLSRPPSVHSFSHTSSLNPRTILTNPSGLISRVSSRHSLSVDDSVAREATLKHFAIYKGVPGNLRITSTHISFECMRGLRRITSAFLRRKRGESMPNLEDEKAVVLFKEPLGDVAAVKKETGLDIGVFDTDGLVVQFRDGKTLRLASVYKRDDAFQFILTHIGDAPE